MVEKNIISSHIIFFKVYIRNLFAFWYIIILKEIMKKSTCVVVKI